MTSGARASDHYGSILALKALITRPLDHFPLSMPLHVEIITPDETVYDGQADAVTLTTSEGEITVLPHHIGLMATLVPGVAVVHTGGEEKYYAVSGGVVEVGSNSLRVLAQTADRAESLQEAAIEQAKAAAEKLVSERRTDSEGFADAVAILDRELARIKTVRRHRGRRSGGGMPSSSGS